MSRTFEGYIRRRILDIDAEYERRLSVGFPLVIDGEPVLFEGERETLQLATQEHVTRWLVLLDIFNEAVAAGAGAFPVPTGLRATSNRSYPATYAQAAVTLRAMRSWAVAAQLNWSRLKDLARAAERREDLNLIDIEAGWPS